MGMYVYMKSSISSSCLLVSVSVNMHLYSAFVAACLFTFMYVFGIDLSF